MLLSYGALNFLEFLRVLKSFYLFFLAMFCGEGEMTEQLHSLDQ